MRTYARHTLLANRPAEVDPHTAAVLRAAVLRHHGRDRQLDDDGAMSARRVRRGISGGHRRRRIDLRVVLNDLLDEGTP